VLARRAASTIPAHDGIDPECIYPSLVLNFLVAGQADYHFRPERACEPNHRENTPEISLTYFSFVIWERSAIAPVLFSLGQVYQKLSQSLSSCDPALLDCSIDTRGSFDRTRPTFAVDRPSIRIEPDAAILHPDGVIRTVRLFAHARQHTPRPAQRLRQSAAPAKRTPDPPVMPKSLRRGRSTNTAFSCEVLANGGKVLCDRLPHPRQDCIRNFRNRAFWFGVEPEKTGIRLFGGNVFERTAVGVTRQAASS
jgi:hypothetical protein